MGRYSSQHRSPIAQGARIARVEYFQAVGQNIERLDLSEVNNSLSKSSEAIGIDQNYRESRQAIYSLVAKHKICPNTLFDSSKPVVDRFKKFQDEVRQLITDWIKDPGKETNPVLKDLLACAEKIGVKLTSS